ncbi:hypothetical protein B0H14DRAFT_2791282 [Mycena olivaceomarginata]|nr:hypothetical protein B0H14DRAFT_2791282 [Mycena olivaceomarginata]
MEVDTQPSAEEFRKQNAKLRKLGRVLRDLLASDPENTRRALEVRSIENLEAFLSSSDALNPEAVWDNGDRLYRCPECAWELEHGECRHCGLEFDINLRDDADYTSNEAFNLDRLSGPRGDTPLRDDGQNSLPPSLYLSRQVEYEELRQRGATRFMCETFNLEFDADDGITAWADGDIYDEFAGPLMQTGDFWKIMLGRRIQLGDDDPDGSLFMEALLEDALIFPLVSEYKWETIEESPGIWATRPIESAMLSDEDEELEPGYAAPILPVESHNYETSDAESDDGNMAVEDPSIKREQMDGELELSVDEEIEEDDTDPGWTYDPNVPDTAWLPGDAMDPPEAETTAEGAGVQVADGSDEDSDLDEGLAEDSADSDFDSDEVLSGDEWVLGPGR